MAKYTKIEVLEVMRKTAIVPVFYHPDIALTKQVVKACYDGGVRAFEFTNRGDRADEIFKTLIPWVEEFCPELILGVGSIVDAPTAAMYIQLGANFIVGPLLNPDVAKVCNRRLIPYTPGCGSVSEIGMAQELGCDLCKIFPAGNVGGPSFVKNIKAPMPWTMLMATGAVSPTKENLTEWLESGVTCVGMGSKLFPKEELLAENWGAITARCKSVFSVVRDFKETV